MAKAHIRYVEMRGNSQSLKGEMKSAKKRGRKGIPNREQHAVQRH